MNDNKLTLNLSLKKKLKRILKNSQNPFFKDELILNHFSYQLVRELLIYDLETLKPEDDEYTNELRQVISTNWNDVRLKVPSSFEEGQGFQVEF